MLKSVDDGEEVEIPVQPLYSLSNGRTQEDRRSAQLVMRSSSEGDEQANPFIRNPKL